jgi:predicted transcriptional regulator
MDKVKRYIELRKTGMTYQSIADIFFVTRQAVSSAIRMHTDPEYYAARRAYQNKHYRNSVAYQEKQKNASRLQRVRIRVAKQELENAQASE